MRLGGLFTVSSAKVFLERMDEAVGDGMRLRRISRTGGSTPAGADRDGLSIADAMGARPTACDRNDACCFVTYHPSLTSLASRSPHQPLDLSERVAHPLNQ